MRNGGNEDKRKLQAYVKHCLALEQGSDRSDSRCRGGEKERARTEKGKWGDLCHSLSICSAKRQAGA